MPELIEQEPWVTVSRLIMAHGGKIINLSAHTLLGEFRDKDQRARCIDALREIAGVSAIAQHTFLYVDRL